jgi:hypothetical protein
MRLTYTFAVLCLALAAVTTQGQTHEQAAPPAEAHATKYEVMGVEAARSLRDALDDPDSFRVTKVWLKYPNDDATSGWIMVCFVGRMKNKTGGYEKLYGDVDWNGKNFREPDFALESSAKTHFFTETCTDTPAALAIVTGVVQDALKADLAKQ